LYKLAGVASEDYRRALDAAIREYEEVGARHSELGKRLSQLQETIRTLCKLCGYEATVPLGLTDACRLVLRSAGMPLTATQVRDRLEGMGLDLDRYANALAAVHTVLKRLTESGDTEVVPLDETNRTAYALIGSGLVASRIGPRTPAPSSSGTKKPRGPRK
jgi:hypothetical protein